MNIYQISLFHALAKLIHEQVVASDYSVCFCSPASADRRIKICVQMPQNGFFDV